MDTKMSATYQQYPNNIPTSMDFPNEFLEPSISAAPIMQNRTNPMFSPNTGYSSTNSSLSSSQNRLICDDSGISPNVTLVHDDSSSSMHFISSAMNTAVNDCMEPNHMSFAGNDLLDDLEPMPRMRSNTWPRQQINNEFRSNNLTIESIQEEETFYSKNGSRTSVHLSQDPFINNSNAMNVGYQVQHANSQELNYDSHNDYSAENSPESAGEEDYQGGVQKRSQTRRNAWGNMSYADLITQAILSAPDQRLTLSQIYEWMVANVPYFSDKGDSNSSAGWKHVNRVAPQSDFHSIDLMEDSEFGAEFQQEFRSRRLTWPLKRLLTEDLQTPPPEPFQIQCYEDSNSSVQSYQPTTDSPLLNNGPTSFPGPDGWTSDSFGYPPIQSYSFQQPTPSTSTLNDVQSWANEEDDKVEWNGRVCLKTQDPTAQRKNPWGEESYADLITRALDTAPNNRLKLNEIYQWFIDNVPYFRERSNAESSAGWKNSIRHNLSLHSRFMRVQNEGAGKSSWWILNPDAAKRTQRRRATMDASTKHVIEKKRRGARKRVEMQQGPMAALANMRKASQPEFYYNHRTKEEANDDSDYDSFRSRTLSNISAPGGSQVSPTFNPNSDDFNYQQWAPNSSVQSEHDSNTMQYTNCNTMKDIMHRTDQISLDNDADLSQMTPLNSNQQGVFSNIMPHQVSPNFQEEMKPQFQQGSYQELTTVRDVDQRMQNPLLRTQFAQQTQFRQTSQQQPQQNRSGDYPFGCNNVTNQQRWQMNSAGQQQTRFIQPNVGAQQLATVVESPITSTSISESTTIASDFNRGQMRNNLPKDLENLNAFVPPDCDLQDIDEILKEELSTSTNLNFNF